MKTTLVLLAALFAATPLLAQGSNVQPQSAELSSSVKAALRPAQENMFRVVSNGDAAALRQVAGADYLTINADGTYMDKAGMLQILPKFKGSTYAVSGQTDRFYGNIALSTGRAKFYIKSILVADVYFTQGWAYRDGQWSYIHWHGTMTGLPVYYPVILLLAFLVLVVLVYWGIRRWRKRQAG